MKVIFTTPVLEYPAAGGPYLRIENSIKALSAISELHIFSRVTFKSMGGAPAHCFLQDYCHSFSLAPSADNSVDGYLVRGKSFINKVSRELIRKNLFDVDRLCRVDGEALLELARNVGADLIWFGYGNISYPLLKYVKSNSNFRVVCDTDSVWSRFIKRGLPYAMNDRHRKKIEFIYQEKEVEERQGTLLADVTTAVSDIDAEYYRSLSIQSNKVHIFSNVIDVESYRQVPPAPADLRIPAIYLAGSFHPRSPMEDAARWMINNVLPLLLKALPSIHFYIVGSGSQSTLHDVNHPNITITGKLPSVLPYLCHVDVALVPLRFESGTRFKILEAGACNIPVVSTILGAEGLAVTHGENILIADSPQEFANAIVALISKKEYASQLASNLNEFVKSNNSVESLQEEGRAILAYLAGVSS